MRRHLVPAAALLSTSLAGMARAEEPAPAPTEPSWSVGMGLSFLSIVGPGTSVGLLPRGQMIGGSYGAVAAPGIPVAAAPSTLFGVEYRATSRTWLQLTLLASGGSSKSESDVPDYFSDETQREGSSLSAGLTAGVRRVLATTQRAQLSAVASLGGAWASYESTWSVLSRDPSGQSAPLAKRFTGEGSSVSAGLAVGLSADVRLTDAFSLRVGSDLAQATYGKGQARTTPQQLTETDRERHASSAGLSGGLAFNPSLQLRLFF